MATPFALLAWAKLAGAAVLGGWIGWQAGHWFGDRDGYNRHRAEVAAEMDAKNARIDSLNAALDEAHATLEAGRDQAEADVAASLRDIPAETRAMCAARCSLPKSAADALEGIQ